MSFSSIAFGSWFLGPLGAGNYSIPLPAGVVPGQTILAFICDSDNTGAAPTAAGWTLISPAGGSFVNTYFHTHAGGDPNPVVFAMNGGFKFNVIGCTVLYSQLPLGAQHTDLAAVLANAYPASVDVVIPVHAVAVKSQVVYAGYMAANTNDPIPNPVITMPPTSTTRGISAAHQAMLSISDENLDLASEPARTVHFEGGPLPADFISCWGQRVVTLDFSATSAPGFGFGSNQPFAT